MQTLLVDGQWNLKRNYFTRRNITANGELCGALFGFLDSLRSAINRTLPDRVIVFWDGFHSGKLRYNIYPPYKASRNKNWEAEKVMFEKDRMDMTDKEREGFELAKQKFKTQSYLEELFVRQIEVDFIEADDLIASYILKSKNDNERFIIFSRDGDFNQLI